MVIWARLGAWRDSTVLGELPSSLWGHASIATENDPVLQLIAWSKHTYSNMMQTWPSQQSTPYGAWVGSTGGTGVDDTKQHSRRRVIVTIYNVRRPTTAQ